MQKLVILDASTGKAHIFDAPTDLTDADEIEEYIDETLHLHVSDCDWMIANEVINHTK